MRLSSLGSGSAGNATLLQWEHEGLKHHLLLDCGFSERELAFRLAERGLSIESLDAILITHEHGDHLGKAPQIAARHGLALWTTLGTIRSVLIGGTDRTKSLNHHRLQPGECYELFGLQIEAVAVPHDANEPVQFIFSHHPEGDCPSTRLGVLTDLGHVSAHILQRYRHLDALVVESNHDVHMLEASSYPTSLKRRVGGDWGHLSNDQCAAFLRAIEADAIPCVIAAHLSQQNNHPDRVRSLMHQAIGSSFAQRLVIADQSSGFDWQTVIKRS